MTHGARASSREEKIRGEGGGGTGAQKRSTGRRQDVPGAAHTAPRLIADTRTRSEERGCRRLPCERRAFGASPPRSRPPVCGGVGRVRASEEPSVSAVDRGQIAVACGSEQHRELPATHSVAEVWVHLDGDHGYVAKLVQVVQEKVQGVLVAVADRRDQRGVLPGDAERREARKTQRVPKS